MSDRFARSLGSRQTDPEYANALSGPRPRHNGWGWWLAAFALPFLVYMVCKL